MVSLDSIENVADPKKTLFSMSFFNIAPKDASPSGTWTVSEDIWIYWLIAVPLTAVTVGTWYYWQSRVRCNM